MPAVSSSRIRAVCAIAIGLAAPVLTQYGDLIARLTGLSRS
jgi:cation:H+ antiporter